MNFLLGVGIVSLISFGFSATAHAAQEAQQQVPNIGQINVVGNERVEPATIASYLTVKSGDPFAAEQLDASLKNLMATGLFADVSMKAQGTTLIIEVLENPIINRIVFEGNKKLDREDLLEEVRLRPRIVYTRAKVRADVQRMLELYRRKGRFAAVIEPKAIQLEQNRVDLVFEIEEGPKTKVRKINFIGNHAYSDGDLIDEMITKESRWWKIFTSTDTYDPDQLAYDQTQLREYYLNEGYADFRIISAVAELTPNREDFIVTFVVEEGEVYEFGELKVESEIRDIKAELFEYYLLMREGDTYSIEAVEKTRESLMAAAGLLGYAFVDISQDVKRDRENLKQNITFKIHDAPRVYVERVNILGNVRTLDRVVRREFRMLEGDAFKSSMLDRSEQRVERLNFFREVEVEKEQGSLPDRMVVNVKVEEQATGELNVGVGFSSLENFIFDFSIQERNLMGKGQTLRLGVKASGYSKSIDLGFTEPYFLGRSISAGVDLFHRSYDQSRYSSYEQTSTGGMLRAGMSISEYWTLQLNYTMRRDVTTVPDRLAEQSYVSTIGALTRIALANVDGTPTTDVNGDPFLDGNGNPFVEGTFDSATGVFTPIKTETTDEYIPKHGDIRNYYGVANYDQVTDLVNLFDLGDVDGLGIGDGVLSLDEKIRGLSSDFQETLGGRTQSIVGYTLGYDSRNSYIYPTRGRSLYFSQNIAGLGSSTKYIRSKLTMDQYWSPFPGWTLKLAVEGGYITGLGQDVRQTDRFYLGGPQLRGFEIRGVGPRSATSNNGGYSIGGNAYYLGHTEVFIPLGEGAAEMGIRASAYVDIGSVWNVDTSINPYYSDVEALVGNVASSAGFVYGDTIQPRISVGIGFSWDSPFGPFRIDLAKALKKQPDDQTRTLQFNVGYNF